MARQRCVPLRTSKTLNCREIGDEVYCFDLFNPLSEVGLPVLSQKQLCCMVQTAWFQRTKRHPKDPRRKPRA
jgi:hypothetical protein